MNANRGATPANGDACIWLLQDGEPLPIEDKEPRLRTGRLAEQLHEAGFRVAWFAGRFDHGRKKQRSAETARICFRPGYDIFLLGGDGYRNNTSIGRVIHQRQAARHFAHWASVLDRPAAILASYPTPELCEMGRRAAARWAVPFFVDVRDPWPDSFPHGGIGLRAAAVRALSWHYRALLRRSLRAASGIISMSDTMLEWALGYAGRRGGDLDRVFYLGYETPAASAGPAAVPEAFSPERPLVCTFYGMFGSCHNGAVVLEAARRLVARGQPSLRFVMAGDGELRGDWESRARGLPNVEFTGWLDREAASARLRASHLGLVNIRGSVNRFWLGNKFFEYAAHGLCIVNDARGEMRDLVERHDIGINVEPDDAEALAQALVSLSRQPARLRECMRNTARLFRERFCAESIYRDYTDYLRRTIAAGGVRN